MIPIITGKTTKLARVELVFLVPDNVPDEFVQQWAADQITLGIGAAQGLQMIKVNPGRTMTAEEQQAALVAGGGGNGSRLRG